MVLLPYENQREPSRYVRVKCTFTHHPVFAAFGSSTITDWSPGHSELSP